MNKRKYVLIQDREVFDLFSETGKKTISKGELVQDCFDCNYGLIGDDERETGKEHSFVEFLYESQQIKYSCKAFTVPKEDLAEIQDDQTETSTAQEARKEG